MTLYEGLQFQQKHLKEWLPRLSAPVWEALGGEVVRKNSELTDRLVAGKSDPNTCGDEVFRGNDITGFICNWHPED